MFVEWEAPAGDATRPVVVFVHGGGGQSLDWRLTADGRPGWVDIFVSTGHPVYIVDRPGHGRSRGIAAHGPVNEPAGPAQAAFVFAGGPVDQQTQWPWRRDPAGPEIRAIAAGSAGLPADLGAAQRSEADRLIDLLERVGPAVLVTHSLGACAAWVVAAERPDLVEAVFALEPAGPPFARIPGVGELTWGVCAAPLPFAPAPGDPAVVAADTTAFAVPGLARMPIAILASPASPFRGAAASVADFLRAVGGAVELIGLEQHGLEGNGHGMMLEANSDDVARFLSDRIVAAVQPRSRNG